MKNYYIYILCSKKNGTFRTNLPGSRPSDFALRGYAGHVAGPARRLSSVATWAKDDSLGDGGDDNLKNIDLMETQSQ